MKYAHSLLCFVLLHLLLWLQYKFLVDLCGLFTYILQGYFTGTASEITLKDMGKIDLH